MMEQTDLLSVAAAADLIGVSKRRALQFITSERLAAQRIGNQYLVSRADAEAFRNVPRPPGGYHPRKPTEGTPTND